MSKDAAQLVPTTFRALHQSPAPLTPDMVLESTCNLGSWEARTAGSDVQDYPWPHSKLKAAWETSEDLALIQQR